MCIEDVMVCVQCSAVITIVDCVCEMLYIVACVCAVRVIAIVVCVYSAVQCHSPQAMHH